MRCCPAKDVRHGRCSGSIYIHAPPKEFVILRNSAIDKASATLAACPPKAFSSSDVHYMSSCILNIGINIAITVIPTTTPTVRIASKP